MHHEALKRAVEIAGGQTALARLVGKRQGHVWDWLNSTKKLAPEIAVAIERAIDGQVRRDELRPDIFDPPGDTTRAA